MCERTTEITEALKPLKSEMFIIKKTFTIALD